MSATVIAIVTAPRGGEDLSEVAEAVLEPGNGIVGDRYHAQIGTFSKKLLKSDDFQITLIESEEIDRFNAGEAAPLPAAAFRRNVVTRGIRLNELVGRQFRIGETELEGIRLCEPCAHLARLLGPAVLERMVHCAGLRARILAGGRIRPGDPVTAGD